tara:strand:- start:1051 stop:1488 length:438 start_codon:yes stop_codon:yes gene_type:complete
MITSKDFDRSILISHLHDQFWSQEYYLAANRVRQWKATKGSGWAGDLFRQMDEIGSVLTEEVPEAFETNAARRLIKSYFRKTQQFCSRGFLERGDLSEHLAMPQRLSMLFGMIEPFEYARKPDYNREMFEFYDDLHQCQLIRPAR